MSIAVGPIFPLVCLDAIADLLHQAGLFLFVPVPLGRPGVKRRVPNSAARHLSGAAIGTVVDGQPVLSFLGAVLSRLVVFWRSEDLATLFNR